MIKRPKQFYIVSLLLLATALSFPVQIMYLYGHTLSEWSQILSKMTATNWIVIGCLLWASLLQMKASKWLFIMAPASIILVAFNNYIVGLFGGDFSMGQTVAATSFYSLLFTPLFMPSSLEVLKDPKKRWWVRSKRYDRKISTTLNPYVGDMIQAYTFDISETGAFISFEGLSEEEMPKVGDRLRLSFNVNSMRRIRCEAVVIRKAEANGRYPQGLGLKFIGFEKAHMKSFQKVLDSSPELEM